MSQNVIIDIEGPTERTHSFYEIGKLYGVRENHIKQFGSHVLFLGFFVGFHPVRTYQRIEQGLLLKEDGTKCRIALGTNLFIYPELFFYKID